MSTVAYFSLKICPVCGDSCEGGRHACSGPVEDRLDDRLERIARLADARATRLARAEVVTLPGDDVLEAVQGLRRVKAHAPDEENT